MRCAPCIVSSTQHSTHLFAPENPFPLCLRSSKPPAHCGMGTIVGLPSASAWPPLEHPARDIRRYGVTSAKRWNKSGGWCRHN